jgi:hypothetical protein
LDAEREVDVGTREIDAGRGFYGFYWALELNNLVAAYLGVTRHPAAGLL